MTEAPRLKPIRAWVRWAEMLAVFFGIPGALALFVDPQRRLDRALEQIEIGPLTDPEFQRFRMLLPTLIVFTIVIAVVLAVSKTFPNRQLWNWKSFKAELPRMLGVFAIGAPLTLAVAYLLHAHTDLMLVRGPDGARASAFLFLPREAPLILVFIAIGYPWFSAYPQEITHRAFFFHRYRAILPGRWAMIGVNAVAFSWLHVPFWNWLALAMTLPAGVLFAWTYDRTKSALAAGFEHSIHGWWVFFTGLGYFVFAGSLRA